MDLEAWSLGEGVVFGDAEEEAMLVCELNEMGDIVELVWLGWVGAPEAESFEDDKLGTWLSGEMK